MQVQHVYHYTTTTPHRSPQGLVSIVYCLRIAHIPLLLRASAAIPLVGAAICIATDQLGKPRKA